MMKQSSFGRSLDDLQAMAVFARVVESRSFTAAARTLDTTTSSVSKRVARLEERLGVRLIERTTRAFSPTEAGLAFHEHCARILRDVDEAELAVTRLGGSPRGTLRVSALSVLGEAHLGPLLGAFTVEYPELRLEVDLNDRLVNLVEEGFDVALRGMERGAAPESSLIARKLATVHSVICAAPSYLARRGVPTRIEDLADHDCLHYNVMPIHREWTFQTPEGPRSVPVTARLQVNSAAALRGAAIAGCGLVRTSRLAVSEALEAGTLVPVLEDYASVDFGLFAVYPAGKQGLPKVKAFVDFLARELSPCLV
jgi:DNA-binding transcriptional LysR family regulator